jgi:SAM-dependent methyltransferase
MTNWQQFIKNTKNIPPRRLLVEALSYVSHRVNALDIGAGALNDSHYLLSQGFTAVYAVDREANQELLDNFSGQPFYFSQSLIEDYVFQDDFFDLINAQNVLPFIKKDRIGDVISSIKKSLKPGGIFVGQFFGENDGWVGNQNVVFVNLAEAKEMLVGLELVKFVSVEKDELTGMGAMKHWHLYNFIAKKS